MIRDSNRIRCLGKALAGAHEGLSFEDLGLNVLPWLQRALGSSGALLYRSTREEPFISVASNIPPIVKEYREHYLKEDPLHSALRQERLWIAPISRLPQWEIIRNHPLYTDWAGAHNLHYFFHVRMAAVDHLSPGSANIILMRSFRQGDFGEDEVEAMQHLFPILRVAARRCSRVEVMKENQSRLEALLEDSGAQGHLALDFRGNLLWISPLAEKLLQDHLGGKRALPDELLAHARRMAELDREALSKKPLPAAIQWSTREGTLLQAELWRCRPAKGDPFVAVSLNSPPAEPTPKHLRERFDLTKTETHILEELAKGLSNLQIARRNFISINTVKTHVARIREKMQVHTRVQAILKMRDEDDGA